MRIAKKAYDNSLLVVSWLLYPSIALAHRSSPVEAPFFSRLLSSLIVLLPVLVIVLCLVFSVLYVFDRQSLILKWKLFVFVGIVIMFVGAIMASADSRNDELSQPFMSGAFPVSLLLPLAVLMFLSNVKLLFRVLIATTTIIPSYLVVSTIARIWQDIGQQYLKLPTTW